MTAAHVDLMATCVAAHILMLHDDAGVDVVRVVDESCVMLEHTIPPSLAANTVEWLIAALGTIH